MTKKNSNERRIFLFIKTATVWYGLFYAMAQFTFRSLFDKKNSFQLLIIASSCLITDVICENTTAVSVNLTVSSTYDLTYLSTIDYECDEGHYFPDGASLHTSHCNETEQWSLPDNQTCSRKSMSFSLAVYKS